jgi:hypothetical protein
LSYRRRSIQATLTSLNNRLKPFIRTVNIIKTTALATATALTDRAAKAGRANAICVRRRTAACEDTYQKNASALRKYTRQDLTQTKAAITTLKTSTDNT